jgi:hypothetical protein
MGMTKHTNNPTPVPVIEITVPGLTLSVCVMLIAYLKEYA